MFVECGFKFIKLALNSAYNERIHMVLPKKRRCYSGHASSFRLEGAELFAITVGG